MLSVIIPVYKIPKDLLKRCIESVLLNIVDGKIDIEILLIDDGSPDECGRWCDHFAEKSTCIRAFHKKNGGLSSARNYGKRFAKGEYITFLDADDWVEPEFYEKIIIAMKEEDADIGIGGMCADDGIQVNRVGKYSHRKTMDAEKALADMYQSKGYIWSVCDKIYKKKAINNLYFHEDILYGEDSMFSYESMSMMKTIVFVPVYGYHYFIREGSMTHCFSSNRFILVDIYKKILKDVARHFPSIYNVVCDFYIVVMLDLLSSIILDNKENYEKEIEIKKELKNYSYRWLYPSKVFTIKNRIKLLLMLMPKCIFAKVYSCKYRV